MFLLVDVLYDCGSSRVTTTTSLLKIQKCIKTPFTDQWKLKSWAPSSTADLISSPDVSAQMADWGLGNTRVKFHSGATDVEFIVRSLTPNMDFLGVERRERHQNDAQLLLLHLAK